MNFWNKLTVILLVSLICVGCDQASKRFVTEKLSTNVVRSYFNDTVRIKIVENHGAFLGLGRSLPTKTRYLLLTVLVAFFLLCFFLYLLFSKSQSVLSLTGLSLMFSGGASNLYDRVAYDGAVVDYLNVGVGPIRTGIFNVADMAILAGVVLYLGSSYRKTARDA